MDFLVPSWYHYGTFWSPLELLEPLGGYLLDILECFGTFWDFLSPFRGHSGLSRDILGPYEGQFWTFWDILSLFRGHSGLSRDILGPYGGQCLDILECFGTFFPFLGDIQDFPGTF